MTMDQPQTPCLADHRFPSCRLSKLRCSAQSKSYSLPKGELAWEGWTCLQYITRQAHDQSTVFKIFSKENKQQIKGNLAMVSQENKTKLTLSNILYYLQPRFSSLSFQLSMPSSMFPPGRGLKKVSAVQGPGTQLLNLSNRDTEMFPLSELIQRYMQLVQHASV